MQSSLPEDPRIEKHRIKVRAKAEKMDKRDYPPVWLPTFIRVAIMRHRHAKLTRMIRTLMPHATPEQRRDATRALNGLRPLGPYVPVHRKR